MSRRFRRPPYRLIAVCIVLAVLVAIRLLTETSWGPSRLLEPGEYRVRRAVDGDTLLLENGKRIRLIGVDTPETVKPNHPIERWGPEASAFTKSFIAGGVVRLEFDRERLDHYGRHLAYVWVGERSLNEELLRAGLARFEPQFHYSDEKKQLFRQTEKEARAAKIGIWSNEVPRGARGAPHSEVRRPVQFFVDRGHEPLSPSTCGIAGRSAAERAENTKRNQSTYSFPMISVLCVAK